jgi:hypothetical protein
MQPKMKDLYEKRIGTSQQKPKKTAHQSKTRMNLLVEEEDAEEESISLQEITNQEMLKKAVDIMLKSLKPDEYEVKETHEYTQILPEKYYAPGSHLLNRQVAFALKNTDDRLFLSWVQLRSKASDFDYNTIPELYSIWKKFHKSNNEGKSITKRSIMYWVKKDNFEEYEKIKKSTVDYYVDRAMETCAEYDYAIVLQHMYKDSYVCVSYDKRGIWYQFKNHRWMQDKGLSLREKISKDMYNLFAKKAEQYESEMKEYENDDERSGDRICRRTRKKEKV